MIVSRKKRQSSIFLPPFPASLATAAPASLSPAIQSEIYKEALLIFYGKVDVYLKAMGKPRPEQWAIWME